MRSIVFRFILIFILSSCIPRSEDYRNFYAHLRHTRLLGKATEPSDYFLVILVDAQHLDYTDPCKFFHSVAKHPNNCSKEGDVGHAWIYLQGRHNGKLFTLEGGHSGERESPPARYFDGLMNYHEWGYANPTQEQLKYPRYEPNPVKYLWTERNDGFFQKGSGGHLPTFAAKITLTQEQFARILAFIRPKNYPYARYALTGPHCTTFVTQVAEIAGLNLNSYMTMDISSKAFFGGMWMRLWEDPFYATFMLPTPDVLEKSLIRAVERGEAENAMQWYKKTIAKEINKK